MKILLIVPPDSLTYKKPLGKFTMSTVPIGLCYIASMLESQGFCSKVLDMSMFNMRIPELERKLNRINPEVIGITSMTNNFPSALGIAKAVKKWNPLTTVVMGGVHATFVGNELLATVPEIDIVVHYEGEITMCELARTLEEHGSKKGIKGISFRENGKLTSNPLRERIENLDELPRPSYRFLEPSIEDYVGDAEKRNFPVLTTRGCPFECIYCSTMAFNGRRYRTRSIPSVMSEIDWLIDEFKINDVSFIDDNFTMQNQRVIVLCKEMEKRKLDLKWGCSARVDQVSEELLKVMKNAGCTDIFFGIESATQYVLDRARKGFTVEQSVNAVKTAENLGIKTHCSFIIGLPGETSSTVSNFLKFLEETKPSGRVLPNSLDIFPGTELYERKSEFFSEQSKLSSVNCTRTQIEMLTRFFEYRFNLTELYRVKPPNIEIE